MKCPCVLMRLTYIYFLIAFTQGSHDFRFDMGRMGIRAGKLTSPEFFDKEVLVLLVRNMCESFDKNGKTKCAHKCFTQSKGFIDIAVLSFKDIAEVSEQISHLLNCAMENNRKRKLQYLFSHVTLG